MKQITCYLDFVSPYAWLAFDQAPRALEGLSYHMRYRPVLLGALFKQHANPGPAGIPPKREWTYRHVTWLGHAQGCGLQMPARHPFHPLPLLRLALACSDGGCINRFTADAIFRHVWLGGHEANDAVRLEALTELLAEQIRPDSQEQAKAFLRANTDEANARGVFGVPMFEVDAKLFWGLDSLPMLRAYLEGDAWFESGQWDACAAACASALP
jgi:2-hydroxychromene-2-carboxylate isomerase